MKAVIGIRLESELIEKIKVQAILEKRNVNDIAKELFESYLSKQEVKNEGLDK
jgi:hypothetical protein